MKMIRWGMLLLLAAIFSSCKDNAVQPTVDAELQTTDQVRQYFSEARQAGNLITEVEPPVGKQQYFHVEFEDGSLISISRSLIHSFDRNGADWSAEFQFSDGTSFSAAMVGTSLPISIEQNPHRYAPLTAMATAKLPVLGKFSVEVLGRGEEGVPISHDFPLNTEPVLFSEDQSSNIRIPVLGLYPDYQNRVVFTFKSPEGRVRLRDTVRIQTPDIPINPEIKIVANELPASEDDLYFVSNLAAGFDQQGAVRWIYTGNVQYLFRRMENGNLLLTANENLVSYHNEKFMEVTILGETIREYTVPNRMHHEVRQMPSGNFLVATNSNRFEGNGNDGLWEEGVVVEMDRQTGKVVKEWDFNQILDTDRNRPPGGNPDDLLHINTAYYDATDHSIVISSKHQSTVAKVDYETGDIIWLLSHPGGWGEQWQPYVLQPVNEDGSPVDLEDTDFYSYFQHAPMRLPNGNILLYDNGNFRNFYTGPLESNYSRAVEYKINKAEKTVQMVWEFDYNRQLFTAATGDVDLLENGHRLIGFMWGGNRTPKIVELDQSGQIVFDIEINAGEGNYYRAEKIDLYSGM